MAKTYSKRTQQKAILKNQKEVEKRNYPFKEKEIIMNTFLPYKSFKKTAKCLDYKRLGKQRIEAFQIIQTIKAIKSNSSYGWKNHPAVLMWIKYPNSLKQYHNIIINEWINRGYKNNMPFLKIHGKIKHPPWLGNRKFHSYHKANLLRKNFNYYSKFKWKETPTKGYYWPV